MEKRQVLLIRLQPLLGEGLQRIFQKLAEVELTCLDCADYSKVETCLKNQKPDVILIAGEKQNDQVDHLISHLLKHYEDIPVVWADLESTTLRLYTSHTLNANSTALINTIRDHESKPIEIQVSDKPSH